MRFMGVNLLAVLASAVATMVVGFVWYSPMVFARPWMVLMGYDPDDKAKVAEMQKGAGASYALSLVASMIAAAGLGGNFFGANLNTGVGGGRGGVAGWRGVLMHGEVSEFPFTPQHAP